MFPKTSYKNANPAWHYSVACKCSAADQSLLGPQFLDRGRHRDTRTLEDAPRCALQFAPQYKMLVALSHFHILHTLQVADNVRPLEVMAARFQTRLQFLPQNQRQKGTEHMSANRFIPLVVDR